MAMFGLFIMNKLWDDEYTNIFKDTNNYLPSLTTYPIGTVIQYMYLNQHAARSFHYTFELLYFLLDTFVIKNIIMLNEQVILTHGMSLSISH